MGQVDASQSQTSLETESLLRRWLREESSSARWNDQIVAADDKLKEHAVEMNREGLWGKSPSKISQPDL